MQTKPNEGNYKHRTSKLVVTLHAKALSIHHLAPPSCFGHLQEAKSTSKTTTRSSITKPRTPKDANKMPLILNVPHMTSNPDAAATNTDKQYRRERHSIEMIGTLKAKDQTTINVYTKLTMNIPVHKIAGKNPVEAFDKLSICELFLELMDWDRFSKGLPKADKSAA